MEKFIAELPKLSYDFVMREIDRGISMPVALARLSQENHIQYWQMVGLRVQTSLGEGKVIGTDDGNIVIQLDAPVNGNDLYSMQHTSTKII